MTSGNDCGLFALAFATDFAEGIDPSERYYDEKALRNHLLQCFRNNEITRKNQKTSWQSVRNVENGIIANAK